MSVAFLVAACLGTGIAIHLLRRWPRLVFAATSVGAAVLIAILATAPNESIDLVGRTLSLDLAGRLFLWPPIGIAAALAFFGPLTFEGAGDTPSVVISNSQGAFFFWSLAPLIVAMALDSFPLAVFCWAIGLMVLVFLAQSRREGRGGGAAQFLLLTVIATASLLLSNRFIDLYPLTPEDFGLIRSAFLFLVWGLGLMLAVAPLHIWLGPLADEMSLLGMAFLVGVAQPVGLWLLLQLMVKVPWLTEKSPLLNVLLLTGGVTIPVGALLALSEQRHGRFLAYLSLVSLGHTLIGFGLGTRLGLVGAILAMFNRAIGVALVAGGLSFVRYYAERRWRVIGAAAILAGGFALAGIPPGPGFVARGSIYHDLASSHPLLLALLFASSATVLFATVRVVMPLLAEPTEAAQVTGEVKLVPYLCVLVVVVLLTVAAAIGIFPQLLADPLIAALGRADYLK